MSSPFGPPPPGYPPSYPPQYPAPGPYAPQGQLMYGHPIPPGTVKTWLMESILALLFCGGVLAIPAIVFAAQVDGHLRRGDYAGAVQASNNAKLWLTVAVCITAAITLFCTLPVCALYILAAIAAAAAG
jgi:interferon-induced transmembrane protein